MHLLYEDNGAFKVGTILADNDSTLQVEALHGKRAKVKANAVLLRFERPAPGELLAQAEAMAGDIDLDFLWECAGTEEFGFEDLTREYVGHAPAAAEAAGVLFKLHGAPVYFHRKGRGRYRAAPPDILKAALAGLEKKRLQQAQIDSWAEELMHDRLPEPLLQVRDMLLYAPDRNRSEVKALEKACLARGLSASRLLLACGGVPSVHDFHLRRFLFEHFPQGVDFDASDVVDADQADSASATWLAELPLADVAAFSIDDASTTEIDDAFSLVNLGDGRWRVGVHIAAPALGLRPQSAAARIARQRLSTVYYPGNKITMLPPSVVQQYSLAEGGPRPALSFYMTVRENPVATEAVVQGGETPSRFVIEQEHSVIERVPVLANLRHQDIGELDSAFPEGRLPAQLPQAPAADSAALYWLWQFAGWLEQSRGRAGVTQERPDFNFSLEPDVPPDLARISITTRSRGTPLDKLVAELMIRVNHAWGKLLDEHQVAAIYRSQGGGKVRMSSTAAPHQGLGISHYAWSSSPLRRYVDLLNQWQLLALLRGEAAPFARNDETLLAAIHDFESTYAAYGEFQDRMERYWCLRWLQQEGVQHLVAEVVRDNLVRLERLPLYARIAGLPEFHPGHRVELLLGEIDLLDAELSLIYHRSLSPEITEIV